MSAITRVGRILAIGSIVLVGACGASPGRPGTGGSSSSGECSAADPFDRSRAVRPGECGAGEVLVQGMIVRLVGGGHTYDGPLALGEDSAAHITLWGSHGDIHGDAPAETIVEQVIAPVRELPLSYCVAGSLARASAFRQVGISAEVRQHADRHTVGDLIDEVFHELTPPQHGEPIGVTGMESCKDPNAGGFCLCNGRT